MKFLTFLNYAEAWGSLLPLFAWWATLPQQRYLKPIKTYIHVAIVLNVFVVVTERYLADVSESVWVTNNNYVYNIHSIIRFLCFCAFFNALQQPFLTNVKKVLPFAAAIFTIINFWVIERFFLAGTISSNLLATESGMLLFYCLQYFLFKVQDETLSRKAADFWITTGLSIYVVFNFPYFVLYTHLTEEDQGQWWMVHNVFYVVFCIFISKAFYVAKN